MIRRSFLLICALACLLSTSLQATTDLVGLYLTWQGDPATTMTVNWVNLYDKSSPTVWYREKGSKKWSSREAQRHQAVPSSFQVRRVELIDLSPETMYEFAIGDQAPEDPKALFKFKTMPKELTKPFSFVNGGDMMHSREMLDAMNKRAASLDPQFVFVVGDLAYENGTYATRFFDWFQSWTALMRGKDGRLIPLIPGIGNHEVRGHYNGRIPEDAPYYYSFFAVKGEHSYFTVDFGKYLSIVSLDSAHTQPIHGAQAEWLEKTLAARADQQFLFAGYHWPVYGTAKAAPGKLPSDHERSLEIRTNWINKFEQFGVSTVFEHDHHTYKRTHKLRNNKRDDENGILFLGDGAWGVNTRPVITPDQAWYLVKSESRRHLHHVTLHPEGKIEFKAIDAAGEVFDSVTLDRARTKPVDSK